MKFFRKILLIIFPVFIFCAPLRAMEQKLDEQQKTDQIKVFIMAYAFVDSDVLVLGGLENNTWMPLYSFLPMKKIKDENFYKLINKAIAKAHINNVTSIDQELMKRIISEMMNNLITEAAVIAHQQSFGLFAKKEKGLTVISDSDGIKYFKDKIIQEDSLYNDDDYNFAIVFIKVPHIDENVFQETQKSSGNEQCKKDVFMWLELDKLGTCVCDDYLEKIFKTDQVKNEIAKLKKDAQANSAGVQTKETYVFKFDD